MRNRLSPTRLRKRTPLLGIEGLEDRVVPAAILNITNAPTGIFPQFDLVDPNPDVGGAFGTSAVYLPSGNIVVTDPKDDAGGVDAGAVYLFNGSTGALISTLTGSHANDKVGSVSVNLLPSQDYVRNESVTVLANGNFVVRSSLWDNGNVVDAGAVTWGSGTTGIGGVVSASNSLVGTQSKDLFVDMFLGDIFVTALPDGNYIVPSPNWDNGAIVDAGAITWGDGTKGVSGAISSAISLVGSTANDNVGSTGVAPFADGVTVLANGNYVVSSPRWDNGTVVDAGAITWGDGSKGIRGAVTSTNSLVGSKANDFVSITGVTALSNGNYVVRSPYWDGAAIDVGAVTWGDGSKGINGPITVANSLVGSQVNDQVGIGIVKLVRDLNVASGGVTVLSNGNYVVTNTKWDNGTIVDAGAVTWADGTKSSSGAISIANSLVGSSNNDTVGDDGVTVLTNGNYVVGSSTWDNGTIANAGAATWADGTKSSGGAVSIANSLVGSNTDDNVGISVTPLTNGNYVVSSPRWTNGTLAHVGAATWGDGTIGISGLVTATNSLVGSRSPDFNSHVSFVTALTNGNYVVSGFGSGPSPFYDPNAYSGSATWGDGTKGISGIISKTNSLVGTAGGGVLPLANGNYVVNSSRLGFYYDRYRGINGPGAITWGNGTTGTIGTVSTDNSLFGSKESALGSEGIFTLANGNYVINGNRAVLADGSKAITGINSSVNGVTGSRNYFDFFQSVFNPGSAAPNGNIVDDSSGSIRPVGATLSRNGNLDRKLDSAAYRFESQDTRLVSPQNTVLGIVYNGKYNLYQVDTAKQNLLTSNPTDGSGRVSIGFLDANMLTFSRGGSSTLNATTELFTESLNAGKAVVSQATATITVAAPIVSDNPNGNGGALTLQSQGALNLNANITTDNGNLTLLGTIITPAAGVTVNTGTGTFNLPTGKLVLNQTLTVNGGVNLSGVSLTAMLLPTIQGKSVTLIDKLSAGPIAGTFAGLAQGAQLTIGGADFTISYTGGDGNDTTLTRLSASVSVPVLVGFPQFAAGTDVGGGTATLFDPGLSVRFSVTPFVGFTGGVRTATADFNGDGVADLVVGTGPGIATQVRIFDGKTQAELFFVSPFENTFTGGVYISAGDVTGDGIPDLAITPDEGGGPRADVYSGAIGFPKIASFFGIDDTNFRGGARSAIADMTGDGVADLVVVAGFGGGPRVAAFEGRSLSTGTPVKIFGDFFAFEQALRNGIFVTAGDINGDGFADLIAGGGPGGGPRVLALDGKSLLSNQYVNLANFFGVDVDSRGGIRVAVKNLDGDTKADLVVGSGAGAGSRVTGYLGANIAADGTPLAQFDFDALDGFTGGVFVG